MATGIIAALLVGLAGHPASDPVRLGAADAPDFAPSAQARVTVGEEGIEGAPARNARKSGFSGSAAVIDFTGRGRPTAESPAAPSALSGPAELPKFFPLAPRAITSGFGFGLAGGGWALAGSQALHGLIVLAVGIGLYAIKWFGAGDAKFWAGIAAWFPLSKAPLLLVSVAIGAVMLVFVWFVLRRLLGRKAVKDGRRSGGELPFGVAISLGAAMAYFICSGAA